MIYDVAYTQKGGVGYLCCFMRRFPMHVKEGRFRPTAVVSTPDIYFEPS